MRTAEADQQQAEKRPGSHRQADIRTAMNYYQVKAVSVNNPTPAPRSSTPTGLTIQDLEALASHIGVKIEDRQQLPGDRWGVYNPETRTIALLDRLAPIQRRHTLAVVLAHARLTDIIPRGHTGKDAHRMAAQMVITRQDWETIGPVWGACQDSDPMRVFEKCGIMPSLARAYSEVAEQWHPDGCIGWDALCGRSDDDDIHSFAPAHLQVSDFDVRASLSLAGVLGGEEPLDPGMGVEIDLPAVRDHMGSFHLTPGQAREFAAFLTAQADGVDAWSIENADLLDGERQLVTAGGGHDE